MYEDLPRPELERELEALRREYDSIVNSSSWKLTLGIQKIFTLLQLDKLKKIVKHGASPAAVEKKSERRGSEALLCDSASKALHKLISSGKAKLDPPSGVNLMSANFFKEDGTTYYSGGAERYIIDLYKLCAELGRKYTVFQFGSYDWVRFYGDMEVRSIHFKDQDFGVSEIEHSRFQNDFIKLTEGHADLNIYSPFFHTARKDPTRSIGISHGIGWDTTKNNYAGSRSIETRIDEIVRCNSYCDEIVSVDTNTPNWFQTMDYQMGNNMVYVPNYVDVQQFVPHEKSPDDPIVILYARRMYAPRGLYLMLDLVDEILERYQNVVFRFVGKGFEEDTRHIEEKIARWGSRVEWYSLPPDEMHKAYEDADISVIPTLWSEGTSLSCLESLASGNAVIATRIGGLCDIMVDGYNGRLVEPKSWSVREALVEMLENPEIMKSYKLRGRESALAFDKNKWDARWKKILQRNLNDPEKKDLGKFYRVRINASLESLDEAALTAKVEELLANGAYVFLAFRDVEHSPYRFLSSGRLQFIDRDEDLYFEFEETIEF